MSGIRIEGNTSGNVAECDTNNQLRVVGCSPTAVLTQGGAGFMYCVQDEGLSTGAVTANSPEVSDQNRMLVGLDTPLFEYTFSPTAQDTGAWCCLFTTMTMTQGGGSLLLNANSTATATTGCYLRSWRVFTLMGTAGLKVAFNFQVTATPLTNQNFVAGLFTPTSATAEPAEGAYFKYSTSGLYGIVNFNGVETQMGPFVLTPLPGGTISPNTSYEFIIVITETDVRFWVGGILMGTLLTPAANPQPYLTGALPVAMQLFNNGTVTGSPQMQAKVGNLRVTQREVSLGLPFGHLQGGMGLSYQGLAGGTMGSVASWVNSTFPTAAVMTNTTAALGVGLGGKFAATCSQAVNLDGILCSFQNPVGSINQPPRTLVITGVRLQGVVTTVLAGGPLVNVHSIAYGHTVLSLATAESGSFASGTTKAPRRIALGTETYAATAPVGTIGSVSGVVMSFEIAPVFINPGEYVALTCDNVGTVGTGGVVLYLVTFEHYFI
jgi:hypothetical protein